ncbi:MAG: transposase [Xanthobacteraceae bacterium]
MSRLGRIVIAGLPHHVTRQGNRRQRVFFADGDYALYRDLLAERYRKAGVAVWAYCLMPNHVHLSMVPQSADGLARAVGETHRQYTAFVNARARWTGLRCGLPVAPYRQAPARSGGCAHCGYPCRHQPAAAATYPGGEFARRYSIGGVSPSLAASRMISNVWPESLGSM